MPRQKSDLSRLVILEGLLLGLRQLRGEALGPEALVVIDDSVGRIRLQLKQLHWPIHNPAPFPV